MSVLRLEVLLGAALLASPALWAALVEHRMTLEAALVRYLLAVVLCAVGVTVLRALLEPRPAAPDLVEVLPPPRRRRTDPPSVAAPETDPDAEASAGPDGVLHDPENPASTDLPPDGAASSAGVPPAGGQPGEAPAGG